MSRPKWHLDNSNLEILRRADIKKQPRQTSKAEL